MSRWFDGQFEEGDVRRTAADLLDKANKEDLTKEDLKLMGDAYGDMCNMVLVKMKQLFEDKNPMTPLAIQYLAKFLSPEELKEKLVRYYDYHSSFMDVMMTLLLIRDVEYTGNVKEPFEVDFTKGTTSHVK